MMGARLHKESTPIKKQKYESAAGGVAQCSTFFERIYFLIEISLSAKTSRRGDLDIYLSSPLRTNIRPTKKKTKKKRDIAYILAIRYLY